MTEKTYKWLKRVADFIIPVIDAGLMVAVIFGTNLSIPLKIAVLIMILLLGNVLKYEIKKKLAHTELQK